MASREADAARRDEALFALRTSTKQISRLASQLLTLSRAEPGSRRPRSDATDLTKAAREILEAYAEEALKRNIDVGLEAVRPVIVDGDATMLREMLVNLIDNAIRYTRPNGRVTVAVEQADGNAVVTVEDNGPGIPSGNANRFSNDSTGSWGPKARGVVWGLRSFGRSSKVPEVRSRSMMREAVASS